MNFFDKIKFKIWRAVYPIFPKLQSFFVWIKITTPPKERQPYHIGWLTKGRTLAELKNHLRINWGFGNHFVAWGDPDQVLSWRKFEGFKWQYHLRVYKDGEIRGHFEYTPEDKPLDHFNEVGEQNKHLDFLKFLGEFVSKEKYISNLKRDPHAHDPDSEITFTNASLAKN